MSGAAESYVQTRVSGRVALNETRPLVGTSLVQLLRPDPERLSWLIMNRGTVEVTVSFSQDFSAGNGIVIGPAGSSMTVNVEEDFLLPIFPVYAVASAAAQQLVLLEIRRESE